MTAEAGFALNATLAADTLAVAELAECTLRLMDDSRYVWAVLVPRVAGVSELHELDAPTRHGVLDEVNQVAVLLATWPGTTKINIGALGNIVRQLHIHLIARHEGDAAWPGPAWGHGMRVHWRPEEANDVIAWIRDGLAGM